MTQTPLNRYLDTVTAPFPPDTARRIRHELEEHALAHADALRAARHPDPEGAAQAALGSASQVQQAPMGRTSRGWRKRSCGRTGLTEKLIRENGLDSSLMR